MLVDVIWIQDGDIAGTKSFIAMKNLVGLLSWIPVDNLDLHYRVEQIKLH